MKATLGIGVWVLAILTAIEGLAQAGLPTESGQVGRMFVLHAKSGEKYQASQSITLATGFTVAKGEVFSGTLGNPATLALQSRENLAAVADANAGTLRVCTQGKATAGPAVFRLYNHEGWLLATQSAKGTTAVFDMRGRPSGLYIVRMVKDGLMAAKKVGY